MTPTPPGSPPSAPDLSAQVEATKQLTAVMAAFAKQLEKTNKGLRDQSEVSEELSDILDEMSEQRDKEEKQAKERQEQLEKEIKSVKSLGDLTGLLTKKLEEWAEKNKKVAVGLAAVTGAAKGFKAGITLMNNVLSGLGGILSTIIGTVFDLGVAILTGPIKMFNALFSKAKQAMSGSTELATALEKIRENFGDIGSGLGGIVAGMGKSLTQGVIVPGLSAMRVFGNVAEATAYANEMASLAPAAFQKLSAQFKDSAKEALAMAKGLGISKEEFAGLMNAAVSSGRDVVEIQTEITKYAKGMAKEFGLDSKMISRDMGRAMKDVKHFANVSVKELAKATTYAHGLGLELKDITGVLDAFNTFESAAESVSKLSQAFGINLDTMKLLEAETPDQALDQIKQAFNAAGKSADQMSRRELQLIAQSVNMDEAAVRQALSTKNAGISMDRAAAASAGLEGQTMSTAQAMQALSKDIERVVKAGEPPKGENFFEVFFEGVMEGMERTATFRNLMMNLMKSIHVVRQAGRDLGMQLMEVIPGLKQLLGGLSDMVSPDKIGGLFRAFSKSFVEFFQILKTGGSVTVRELVENLKKNFLDYLTASGPGGQSFLSGLSEMWTAAKKIIASAIDYIGDMLSSGLNTLTDMLSGKFNDQASAVGNAIMGEVSPIADAFGRMFEKLKGPLAKLGEQALSFIGNTIGKYLEENWGKILGAYLSFAFIGAFATAFAQATGTAIMKTIITPFLQKLAAQILTASAASAAAGSATTPVSAAAAAAAGSAASPFEIGAATFKRMGLFMGAALLAVGAVIALVRFFDVTTEEVIKAVAIVGAAALLAVAAGAAVMMVAGVGTPAAGAAPAAAAALPVLGMAVGAMFVFAAATLGLAALVDKVTPASIAKVLVVLAATSALILVAAGLTLVAGMVGTTIMATGGLAAGAMGAGLMAIGAVVVAMIATAGTILYAASKIEDANKVETMTKLVMAVGGLYIDTIPIMSAILKAIVIIAAGPAAIAGFDKLGEIVKKIIETANDVIKEINKLPGDASTLKNKVEPFVSVMKSITEMIKAIGGILRSVQPSDIDMSNLANKNPFEGASNLISILIGKDKGSGILGILETIKNSISILQKVPVESVRAFAEILLNVTKIFGEITGIIKVFKARSTSRGMFGSDEREYMDSFGNSFTAHAPALQKFMESTLPAVSKLIDVIALALKGIDPATANAVAQSASGIGQVMTAAATVLQSLSSNLSGFRKKTKDVKGGAIADDVKEIDEFDVDGYVKFMDKFTEKLSGLFNPLQKFIDNTMQSLVINLSTIDPTKLEAFKPAMDILVAVMNVVSSMYLSLSKIEFKDIGTGALNFATNKIAVNIPSISELISGLSTAMPTLFSSLASAVNSFNLGKGAKEKIVLMKEAMSAVSAVFSAINEIIPDVKSASGLKVPDPDVATNLQHKILTLSLLLLNLSMPSRDESGTVVGNSPFAILTKALNDIPAGPSLDSVKRLTSFAESLKSLKTMTEALNGISDVMSVVEAAPLPGGQIGPPTAEQAKTSSITERISNVKLLLDAIGNPESGIPTLDKAVQDANKNIRAGASTEFTALMSKLKGYGEIKELPAAVNAVADALPKTLADASLGKLSKALGDFETQLKQISGAKTEKIAVELRRTLDTLGVKGAKYTVEAKPINITVDLSIIMKAGDVADGIAKSSNIIKHRIEQLAVRSGVQNYDISQTVPVVEK